MALQNLLAYVSSSSANRAKLDAWLADLIAETEQNPRPVRSSVERLRELLTQQAELSMLAQDMFQQEPARLLDRPALSSDTRVRDLDQLLRLLDAALDRAPVFDPDGLVGLLPIYSLLNWFLCTPAGARLFLDPRVNAAIRPILDDWAGYLSSEASRYVLHDREGGWFSAEAMRDAPDFDDDFVCDPKAPHRGFQSWDEFFTRRLRPGARPVAEPEDGSVVVNACESAPFRISEDVAATDTFWIKDHPYSLRHMLGFDTLSDQFVGGVVYQALLGPTNYHRWHSPVAGRIVSASRIDGIYYWIEPAPSLTMVAAVKSQAYLSQVATRAVIFIEADNPEIGLMAAVFIGMMECSTCELRVQAGDRVEKGGDLGTFHFGGSTHCLLFRPGVNLTFELHGHTPGTDAGVIPVRARLASIGARQK